ncbi:MAG: sigma-70 family RNA polymerase sigma factor [Actinomycetota bacterium]|nr:sigma-70 family RNA polymerase sigma factor [Actinomycetota bacterium]
MTGPCRRGSGAVDPQRSEAPVERRDELLDALRSEGPQREDALRQLHALLLRAARFEIARRREAVARVRGEELDDLANQAADDALVAVLGKLDDYRGRSRFTTWAYKFALLEAGVRLRRRAWQDREVVLAADAWPRVAGGAEAQLHVQRAELLAAVHRLVHEALTPHQRRVLVTLAVEGVPIDVLAERLSTTRGALYKTLHDARRKLRAALGREGLSLDLLDS